jgi:hypothetical protein
VVPARVSHAGADVDRVDEAIAQLLVLKHRHGFRNKHLAQALGVSQARASQILAARVRFGELIINGDGRGGPYIRGPACMARGSVGRGFWRELTRTCPCIAYVSLCSCGSDHLMTRHQIRAALRGVGWAYKFVLSQAACDELYERTLRRLPIRIEAINAVDDVARILARAAREIWPQI